EEGIDYEEVFAPVARIEATGLFLAYASFMGFMVYQMDVKSAFLYGTIEEEIYVCQPPGFEDPHYPDKVYKVVKALYGLHQAPRAWYETLANYLLDTGFQRGEINQTLFIKRQKDRKSIGTPIHTEKPLLKDPDDQTVSGKDSSNPLMADNFPKILWYSTHYVALMKSWLDQKQTALGKMATGKENSNPFMAEAYCCMFIEEKVYAVKSKFSDKMNDVTRLQALDDKKKVIITKATIRDALRLDDAESIDCLPTEEIFTELSRMRYKKPSTKLTFYKAFFSSQWKFIIYTILQCMSAKRTSWNEFSSSMASAVICLSTGRKFNFSKAQVGDLSSHSIKYSSPVLTQKVFSNMRRVGKGFSGVDTPLFEGMIAAQQDDDVVAEGAASVAVNDVLAVEEPSIPSLTPTN
nr:putative ribonuclease H-like domain-containing protein [Tanacetum cinerariifolium]